MLNTAPANSSISGMNGSALTGVLLGMSIKAAGIGNAKQRELLQAALPVRGPSPEWNVDPGKPQPVAQPVLLGEQHPARKARQARLGVHGGGQLFPVEPQLG